MNIRITVIRLKSNRSKYEMLYDINLEHYPSNYWFESLEINIGN